MEEASYEIEWNARSFEDIETSVVELKMNVQPFIHMDSSTS
jgi:hypothetical protein